VALFGSVARGEASELSDIDLLAILKGTASDPMQRFLYILRELRKDPEYLRLRGEGFLPDPFPIFLTEKELDVRSLILLDVLDHGIILYDEENCLKRRLEALERRLRELGSKKIYLSDGSWFWDLKPDWKPGEIIEL
jgi:predicted nucleotidyltransferase